VENTDPHALLGFAELRPGMLWRSPARTLGETELALFTMLTGDRHPLHADAVYAQQSAFGQRIFHGSFGIALAIALCTGFPALREPIVAATGLDEWRFELPLFVGDTVYASAELLGLRTTRDGARGVLQRRLTLCKHDGAVAQQGAASLLVQLR
jgi:acyl dehydratase